MLFMMTSLDDEIPGSSTTLLVGTSVVLLLIGGAVVKLPAAAGALSCDWSALFCCRVLSPESRLSLVLNAQGRTL